MTNLSYIFKDLNNTKNLILIDDSKSKSKVSDVFINKILQDLDLKSNYHIIRNEKDILFQPNEDDMKIDYDYYVKQIKKNGIIMNSESSDLFKVARQFLLKSVDEKYSYNFSWFTTDYSISTGYSLFTGGYLESKTRLYN